MAAISTQDLYYAYLAYFGRPPDATGLLSFADATEAEVVAAFSASQESIDLLAGVTPSDQINNIYLNVLNRDAEPAGLLFWLNEITLGHITLAEAALAIVRAALLTADAPTVTAKYNAQVAFVDALDTTPEIIGYQGDEAAADARAWLHTVGADNIPTPEEVDAAVLEATTPFVEPPPPEATYEVNADAPTVNEGQSAVFTITTTNVAEFTLLSYTLTGISASDLASGSLTGFVQVDASGQAVVQVALKADSLTEGTESLTLTLGAGLATASVDVLDTSIDPEIPSVVGVTKVATTGIDILNGTSANDTFVATNATLQNGDQFNGLGGNDRLNISFSGNSSDYYDGFETNSVELVEVKNLADGWVTLDVSDVNYDTENGKVTFASRESGNDLSFWDIQSISDTNLAIVDTEYDTYYWFDAGSSALDDNGDGREDDVSNITIGEMRGTVMTPPPGRDGNWYQGGFGVGGGTDGTRPYVEGAAVVLGNTANFGWTDDSYVDVIRLQSGESGQTSPTTKNTIELHSGEDLDRLVITGNADLEITNTLDANIRVVDAGGHLNTTRDLRADLILDLSNSSDGILFKDERAYWTDDANGDGYVSGDPEDEIQGRVDLLSIVGSQGDDLITTGITHNDKDVQLGTGNDTLVAAGWISSAPMSAATTGGEGNDVQQRHPSFEILWGGEAVVDGGTGNDVIITGNLNDSVVGGDGNDIITDGGSTAWNTRNTNYFHSEPMIRYDPDYVDDGNSFDLGKGDDQLTVYSALNVLGDPAVAALAQSAVIYGSNNTVVAGEGDDVVDIYGSAIDGYIQPNRVNVWDAVTSKVDLGDGDDNLNVGDSGSRLGYRTLGELVVNYRLPDAGKYEIDAWGGSRGDVSVMGGADTDTVGGNNNDNITIWRDGTHTVDSGSGNDIVAIHGDENEFSTGHYDSTAKDGAHQVTLGTGNDQLWITGRAWSDKPGVQTNIDAGSGDDWVQIDQEHRLSAKLGDGADTLMLRAQDLQSNDTVQGGNNYMTDTVNDVDRIILTNETHSIPNGEVRDSETRHVFSIEEFWLLDSAIRLHITDNLVETALNNKVVVDTTLAERGQFPVDLGTQVSPYSGPRFQGMTYQQWDKINPNPDLLEDPNTNIVEADGVAGISAGDKVYFVYRASELPTQTVDLTKLNTVDYSFELRGGGLRDLVIVDEDALSQDLVLNFDAGGGSTTTAGDQFQGWSQSDTLQIIDGATVRAADMENVNELEIIDLVASSNIAQTWTIELNNHVINQPTGLTDLTIRIDPNVPANSKVYIVMSEDNTNLAENNVIIERNSNVQVYISTDPGDPWSTAVLVTEPQYNTQVANFNGSGFGVWVKTAMFFTENADNLPGTPGNDLYIAQTLDHVQSGDMVNANGGFDTVKLLFAVAAQANTLQDQLENVQLNGVDQIQFSTENNVQLRGIGLPGFAPDLTHITTGLGNDRLELIERSGLTFTLDQGNDYVSFLGDAQNGRTATVIGGAGSDSVVGTAGNDSFHLGGVEYVDLGAGEDSAWFDQLGGNAGNTTVLGGAGNDRVYLDADGTDLNDSVQGIVYTSDVESVVGGAGVDRINAQQSAGNLSITGGSSNDVINAWGTSSTNISVWGEAGADTINVDTNSSAPFGGAGYGNSASVYVDGGSDGDVINVGSSSPVRASVLGGSGNDVINVATQDFASVQGNEGSDTIRVSVGGALSNSDNIADAVVYGDSAGGEDSAGDADRIYVQANDDVTVYGGGGADSITVCADNDSNSSNDYSSVFGQDGADTITVLNVDYTNGLDASFAIRGGRANDVINLYAGDDGVTDRVVFDDITYTWTQNIRQATNDNGHDTINGFNFEDNNALMDFFGIGGDAAYPGADDVLDFSNFLTGSFNPLAIEYAVWDDGVKEHVNMHLLGFQTSKVLILSAALNFSQTDLENALSGPDLVNDYLGKIEMGEGSRNVIIVAKDAPEQTNNLVGYNLFDVYYVQDVNTGEGTTWAVDQVATINASTTVGLLAVGPNQITW